MLHSTRSFAGLTGTSVTRDRSPRAVLLDPFIPQLAPAPWPEELKRGVRSGSEHGLSRLRGPAAPCPRRFPAAVPLP